MPRQTGTIKFFNEGRGYGFVTPDEGSQDAFLHIRVCEQCRFQPKEGARVSFEAEPSKKGLKITWIG